MSPARERLLRLLFLAGVAIAATSAGCWQVRGAPRDANGNRVMIGGRPHGCPSRYCGCGLARFLGLEDRRLWLAANWSKLFRHVHAAPGMAAVRKGGGHVMLLIEHIDGRLWKVRDYNGGRHLSWIHERDVRGYVFVDPSARVGAVQ